MITVHCKPVFKEYYHGTSSNSNISNKLLPPSHTGVISEKGRKKNLDKVFFTTDIGLARIYAGRASRSYGGTPKILRVINPINTQCMNNTSGASVYYADHAFCEEIKL